MKNVFIRKDGQLEIGNQGRLASIEDLEYDVCCGNEPIRGILQTSDGVVSWFDSTDMKFNKDNHEQDEVMEYIRHDNIITLYTELANDTDDLMEEIVNVSIDEGDTTLRALTRSTQNNTVYIYNYSRIDGKVDKNFVVSHVTMFTELFTA